MPEQDSYEHGVPSWVDMGSTDLDGSIAFYKGLFGWETQDMGEEAGHYNMASRDGRLVAGLGPAQGHGPSRWTTYINVDEVDPVVKAAESAGGQVVAPPMDVFEAGRMAVLRDSTGAFVAVWQAGRHKGAQLVNEAGAFIWCELLSSDPDKSKVFYGDVFGWGWGGSESYAEGQVNGRTIAGLMGRPADMPAGAPDSWQVYFGTSNLEADADKAQRLGANVLVPSTEIPGTGRFSVLMDPQDAVFALFAS